jgi:hypothetical protein
MEPSEDRINYLEQAVAAMQADRVETQTQINQLQTRISQLEFDLRKTPISTPHARTVRPSPPPEFDGERSKGLAFLNSCQTYIRLCPQEFPDEQVKIMWAMSFMKSGRAQKWTARIFRWESQPENAHQTRFLDWEDFVTEYKSEFVPAHVDVLAINRLESSAYYQRSRPLDEYIDEFQDLIADSGYTDPKTTVVKFRRGLNAQIQNAVATMAAGRPSDASPENWYKMARVVAENHAANEAFSAAHRPSAPIRNSTAASALRAPQSVAKPIHSHLTPTPGHPVPMDLDATRKMPNVPLCFRCKKPGHFGRDCPNQFDAREMTVDELQDALEVRMARLDIATESPSPPFEPEESKDF